MKSIPAVPTLVRRVGLAVAFLALTGLLALPASAAGICTNTSADNWYDYLFWSNDVIDAEGAWKVNGASSARIQWYVNDTLYQTSNASGTSGSWQSWQFQDNFDECGTHVFKTKVCPRVYSNGAWTVCETHCEEDTYNFTTYTCPVELDVDFSCSYSGSSAPVATLQATINSGNPPYQVEYFFPNSWGIGQSSTTSTQFTDSGRCFSASWAAGIRITDDADQVVYRKCHCGI